MNKKVKKHRDRESIEEKVVTVRKSIKKSMIKLEVTGASFNKLQFNTLYSYNVVIDTFELITTHVPASIYSILYKFHISELLTIFNIVVMK